MFKSFLKRNLAMPFKCNCRFGLCMGNDSRLCCRGLITEFSLTACQQTAKIHSQNLDSKLVLLSSANFTTSGTTRLSENQVDDN